MTALPQYDLLEAEGLYFESDTASPRSVIVKFGDASLMILDTNDMPVTHWPLATLRTVSTADDRLLLTPDRTGTERLSVDDPTMIEALRRVCPDLDAQRTAPRNRWQPIFIRVSAVLFVAYLTIFHLFPSLAGQMAKLIPPDAESAMGETMSGQFATLITGFDDPRFCTMPEGMRALASLTSRLEGAAGAHLPLDVKVLEHDQPNALALPGGHIILTSGLLALATSPEEVAGVLAHEIAHVVHSDPTRLTLRSTGLTGILNVVLGDFSGARATAALANALQDDGYPADVETAADEFAVDLLSRRGLPTIPFAKIFPKLRGGIVQTEERLSYHAGHTDLTLRARAIARADTIADKPFEPALSDQQWVALRGICR